MDPFTFAEEVGDQTMKSEYSSDKPIKHFRWAVDKPQALVFLIHGPGNYSSRYAHVAQLLATMHQIEVAGLDLPECFTTYNKQSSGLFRENIRTYLNHHLMYVETYPQFKKLPRFLMSIENGDSLALSCLSLRKQFYTGLIMSEPTLYREVEIKKLTFVDKV